MSEQQSSYRQILKASSIFGGVQVVNIVIAIIRSKFIAVLLGPSGMGIAGLLTSTTRLIGSITNSGLGISSVKNISAAYISNDVTKISNVVSVLRRLVWITGALGTLITLFFSGWLSQITFGNRDYTIAFAWISITLLLNQLSIGQLALLQGMRKLKFLAKANVAGSFVGLVISVPIYYTWGINGIIPAIVLSSGLTFLFSWHYASKVKIKKTNLVADIYRVEGREMLRMGFLLSTTGWITLGSSYILRVFLSREGGVDQVGYYDAGFAIINTYAGLIFAALGTDYYPRLSGVSDNQCKVISTINQQAEVSLLILAPILTAFLIYNKIVIVILYSANFTVIEEMIEWAALGIYFKAASWTLAYLFIAKGEAKIYFWSELMASIYILLLNLTGYILWGLEGLGISFLIGYFLYSLQVFFLIKFTYSFKFEKEFIVIFGIQFFLGLICFGLAKLAISPITLFLGTIMIILSAVYSYKEINKRVGMNEIYKKIFK